MSNKDPGYSAQALYWAAELVTAYTESGDGTLPAEFDAILKDLRRHRREAELRDLLASLAGVAAHAVMIIASRLEADLPSRPGRESGPEERIREYRTKVLMDCIAAVREFRPAAVQLPPKLDASARLTTTGERRSGFDRRLGTDRRWRAPGNLSETINLRAHGERRVRASDRRSGIDRRQPAAPTTS
jgi:hypothetical protein